MEIVLFLCESKTLYTSTAQGEGGEGGGCDTSGFGTGGLEGTLGESALPLTS